MSDNNSSTPTTSANNGNHEHSVHEHHQDRNTATQDSQTDNVAACEETRTDEQSLPEISRTDEHSLQVETQTDDQSLPAETQTDDLPSHPLELKITIPDGLPTASPAEEIYLQESPTDLLNSVNLTTQHSINTEYHHKLAQSEQVGPNGVDRIQYSIDTYIMGSDRDPGIQMQTEYNSTFPSPTQDVNTSATTFVTPSSTFDGVISDKPMKQIYDHDRHNGKHTTVSKDTGSSVTTVTTTTITKRKFHYSNRVVAYFSKFQGQHLHIPPAYSPYELIYSFIGAFLGIAVTAAINFNWFAKYYSDTDYSMVIGSFGASAVMLYSVIDSPLAQPRNVLGGHLVSAFCGVCIQKAIPDSQEWLSCALAVALATFFMALTRTTHPPGGATALIAVLPSDSIRRLGFLYIVLPVGSGIVIMIIVALLVNNLDKRRTWPRYWW